MSGFRKLNLSTKILSALEEKGYTNPTPIQSESIPHLLNGRDLLGIAQTGTGKTAAFALPILDNLTKSANQVRANGVRSLILTPTRELASQIADNIDRYSNGLGLRHIVIFGGVSINNQIKAMKEGFDIVIATPGRLLDLMNQGHVRFAQLEIFVLDEADRMLDMGFIRDVRKVISKLPPKRQTLLFSATMPSDIASLAESILDNPIKVEVTPQSTTVERIDQKLNLVDKSNKLLLLKEILKQEDAKSVLVFSKTKHGANRIVKYLTEKSIGAAAIHGNKSQAAREKALDEFRKGENKVLVATDIAARGIDVPNITHVINFDIPQDPESYVHRIGRTARAGKSGVAISFCDRSELLLLKAVEKTIRFKIPVDDSHPFHGAKASPALKGDSESSQSGRHSGGRSSSNSRARTGARVSVSSSSSRSFGGRYNSRPSENKDREFNNDRKSSSRDGGQKKSNWDKRPFSRSDNADSPSRSNSRGGSYQRSENSNSARSDFNKSGDGRSGDSRPAFGDHKRRDFSDNRSNSASNSRYGSSSTSSRTTNNQRPRFSDNRNHQANGNTERKPSIDGNKGSRFNEGRPSRPAFGDSAKRSFNPSSNRRSRPSPNISGGKRPNFSNSRKPKK